MRYAAWPAISRPRKLIEPAVGINAPASRLKVVLFPEPFGPMRPRISPRATANETRFTAVNPPKTLVSPLTVSMIVEVVVSPLPDLPLPSWERAGERGALQQTTEAPLQ